MKRIKTEYLNPKNIDMDLPGFFHLKFKESIITDTEITFVYKVVANRILKWNPRKKSK
jgi:hypothetical protein